jgi:hypothetical protein
MPAKSIGASTMVTFAFARSGHYWDASNGMTIASMVAPTRFRATAAGFGYVFVKAAAFFGAFVFRSSVTRLANRCACLKQGRLQRSALGVAAGQAFECSRN